MRYSLHYIKFTGEATDADKGAANEFISSLSKIIEDKDFSPCQLFNVDERDEYVLIKGNIGCSLDGNLKSD